MSYTVWTAHVVAWMRDFGSLRCAWFRIQSEVYELGPSAVLRAWQNPFWYEFVVVGRSFLKTQSQNWFSFTLLTTAALYIRTCNHIIYTYNHIYIYTYLYLFFCLHSYSILYIHVCIFIVIYIHMYHESNRWPTEQSH